MLLIGLKINKNIIEISENEYRLLAFKKILKYLLIRIILLNIRNIRALIFTLFFTPFLSLSEPYNRPPGDLIGWRTSLRRYDSIFRKLAAAYNNS
jgi:hypothetical protein